MGQPLQQRKRQSAKALIHINERIDGPSKGERHTSSAKEDGRYNANCKNKKRGAPDRYPSHYKPVVSLTVVNFALRKTNYPRIAAISSATASIDPRPSTPLKSPLA
jgi:hypothetical protein